MHGLGRDCATAVPVVPLVMKFPADTLNTKAWSPGLGSALVAVFGCHGDLVVTRDFTPRWIR